MQLHFGIDPLKPEWQSAVACIGTFDGVHLGHAAVIASAVREARKVEAPCVLLTFDRHPSSVLAPQSCPKVLAPLQSNIARFAELGVTVAVVLPFNAWLSRLSAASFLDEVVKRAVRANHLVVGHDFAMGNGREGTTDWLSERIKTTVVAPFEMDGQRVSSSLIRELVASGEVATAAKMLGKPFTITGTVVSGDRVGRQLGFPTANIARSVNQVVPSDGVYAGRMRTPFGTYGAAISIGTRPTVGGVDRRIEAFLLDYPGDSLYGAYVELDVETRLRGQVHFGSHQELIDQMHQDAALARSLTASSLA